MMSIELQKAKAWTAHQVCTFYPTMRVRSKTGKLYAAYVCRILDGGGLAMVRMSNGREARMATDTIAESINRGVAVAV